MKLMEAGMNWSFAELAELFSKEKGELLVQGRWGIEREAQRVTMSGDLALTPHPSAFGNKLANPTVTTDFSESQIELITPPFDSPSEAHAYLGKLQEYVEGYLGGELLWPLSMPPRLPEEERIPIARFDSSTEGIEKRIYRNGLAQRYGKKMQMISGIHYNFSFGDGLMDFLYGQVGKGREKQDFINDMYFSMARNFLRYRWLLIYLFGASPDIDHTYESVMKTEIEIISRCCPECCNPAGIYCQAATSLRVSRFGYSESVRGKYRVSYNSLGEYISGIRRLLSMKSRRFSKLGVQRSGIRIQLNDHVLQKESEFYSPIRLKRGAAAGESQLDALERRGVEYAEIRIIDLNPFERTGISLQQMVFLQIFLLYCLLEDSDPVLTDELKRINKNHHLVALLGRKQGLKLFSYLRGKVLLKEWGTRIFDRLRLLAEIMDGASGGDMYRTALKAEHMKLDNPALLPSTRIQKERMDREEDFLAFGIRKALEHRLRNRSDGIGVQGDVSAIAERPVNDFISERMENEEVCL